MSSGAPYPIGIIGCGNIFERYVRGLRQFDSLQIAWCADIDEALAQRRAQELDIARAGAPREALADQLGPVGLVLNLTPPAVHAQVMSQVLEAGKHVYTEKPLAMSLGSAREVLVLAHSRGLQVGAAPDWFLGPTGRAARAAIDSGRIGQPTAVSAFITHSKVEQWHPDPKLFFTRGAGPVFDLGPYYVSALVACLGSVREVAALQRISAPTRAVTAPGRLIDTVQVEVDTHAAAILEFRSGVIGDLTMSFDAWERTMPFIEVYGTEGTLSLPMPHEADGALRCKRHDEDEWEELPLEPGDPYVRGIGVAQMAQAVQNGAEVRASGTLGYHVLEVLCGVEASSTRRKFVSIESTAEEATP